MTTLADRQFLAHISTQDGSGRMEGLLYWAWRGMPEAEKASCSAVKLGHRIVDTRNAGASEWQIAAALESAGFTASEA